MEHTKKNKTHSMLYTTLQYELFRLNCTQEAINNLRNDSERELPLEIFGGDMEKYKKWHKVVWKEYKEKLGQIRKNVSFIKAEIRRSQKNYMQMNNLKKEIGFDNIHDFMQEANIPSLHKLRYIMTGELT